MSELIAEARVLVTPDTTAFRTLLTAQLATATRGVTVPVNIVPSTVGAAGVQAATVAQLAAARATRAQITEEERLAQVRRANNRTAAEHTRQLGQLQRGAAASALSMTGLRGATLAATGPFLAGAAAFAVFAKSVGTAAGLETSLNTFRVTADATADDLQRVSDTARELGTDLTLPGVTAGSAADALAQLARAGLSVDDSIDGVRGTLQLATAAAIDNEQAVLLTANALNAFQLAGEDAARVADLLANASKESQGSIVDVGLALQQSAAAANQAGVSVEDTIALLTQLGRAGLRGSDAGTSLRVALLRLINPSKQAREALEGLGVTIRDEAGNIRPEVFAEITDQLNRLTKAQGDAALATIFGQDAFRAAAIIGREGAAGLNAMRDATQQQGAAAELASARTQGLAGAFENLKNQAEGLGLTIGDAIKGPLTDFTNFVAGGIANINTFVQFLDRMGQSADNTAVGFEELQAAAALRELKGDEAAIDFLERIQSQAGQAAQDYADLVVKVGQLNRALAERGDRAGQGLIDETAKLTKELEEQVPAALTARDGIEAYRASLDLAAQSAEGLRNRIDETTDRFAVPLPEPAAPPGPTPIGPTAKLDAAAQIAASNEELRELERIQEVQLANAKRAFENSKGNVKQREALFLAQAAAQAALNNTRRQIAANQEANARAAQQAAEESARAAAAAATAADRAFLEGLASARSVQQNAVARAEQTAGAADDIRETKELRTLIQNQIALIRGRKLDEDTKQASIQALVSAVIATTGEIQRLQQAEAAQRAANRQAVFDRTAENAALRTQIAEARDADESVIVAFINQEIAVAQAALRRAKVAGKGILAATLEVERLREKKRELLEEAEKDTAGGTTLVDLFNEAQEIAGGAGNVGQTATGLRNIPANIRIRTEVQERLEIVNDPAARQAAQQKQATDSLIGAIQDLTAAITGGNGTTGGRAGGRNVDAWKALSSEQRFFFQKQAKAMVDHGLAGRGGI